MLSRSLSSRIEVLGMKLPRALGFVPKQLKTNFTVNNKKVFFLHNPKAGGSSLKYLLQCQEGRTLHIWASGAFPRKVWEESFIICAVREPMSRFLSGYKYHVKSSYRGYLYKQHGEAFKNLSPEEYFELMLQYPDYLGPQSLWFTYEGSAKVRCDLILRTEDSSSWTSQLREQGIPVDEKRNVRKNVSVNGGAPIVPSAELRARVEEYYRQDYELLGY